MSMPIDVGVIDPLPEQVKLSSGSVIVLQDLRARQFFKFLRIITHGAMPIVQDPALLKLSPDMDAGEFGTRLLSIMVLSIPDAEDETIEFVRSMCEPYGLISGRGLNKQDTERNRELWTRLYTELDNPALEDLLTLIEAIVRRESADIQALGKRLTAMFNLAEKTGQLSPNSTSPTPDFSAGSPEPSTSSVTNTDGPTDRSATSASDASVSVSPPSESAVSTSNGTATSG